MVLATRRLLVNIVFHVALTSAISAVVVVAAMTWSLRQRRGLLVPHSARRVLVALERASWAAIRRRAARLLLPLVGTLCLVVAAQYVVLPGRKPAPVLAFELLATGCVVAAGMVSSLGVAFLCGHHARKHAFLPVASASISVNRCLTVSASSASSLAVAAEAAGLLATIFIHGLVWLLARGASHGSSAPIDAANMASRISPYFGIGAALVGIALSQTGLVCVGATRLTGSLSFENRTNLSILDPRNPAVLLEGLTRLLSGVVPRSLDAYVSGALFSAISLQLLSAAPSLGWIQGSYAIAAIPLLVRGFGLLASLSGMLAIHSSEHDELGTALVRGQVVAHVVLASALAGIAVWTVGAISAPIAVAALVGLALATILGQARGQLLSRARRAIPTTADGNSAQSLNSAIDSTAAGLTSFFLPIPTYVVIFIIFELWFRNDATSMLHKTVAILIGLSAPSALNPFHHMVALFRDFESLGSLAASVGHIAMSEDATHRLRKIAEGSERVGISADSVLSDSAALLGCLVALICQTLRGKTALTLPPSLTFAGISILALIPLLLAVVQTFRAGARAARTQLNEADRQLRGMRRAGQIVQVPGDFVPSYRSCIELFARDSAKGGDASAVAALMLPLISLLWFVSGSENTAGSAALGLASYVAIAAATGLAATQLGHAAIFASRLANRSGTSARQSATTHAVPLSDPLRLVEYFGYSLAVTIPPLTRVVALSALAFTALLAQNG